MSYPRDLQCFSFCYTCDMRRVNDYDSFATQRQADIKSGKMKSHFFIEKPAMKSLLPELSNKRVLMIGCGTGDESELLKEYGAKELMGIDVSRVSLDIAKKTYPEHDFQFGDMNNLQFGDETFDFIYSSLALDYAPDPLKVYKEVFRVLKHGGQFQFSVPHPARWAGEEIEINGVKSRVLGFSEDKSNPHLYGSYMRFEQGEFTFQRGDTLRFWIGPPSLHFRLLKKAGFIVSDFVETQAIEEVKSEDPYYFEKFSNFPQFMLFLATKTKGYN